MATFCNSSNFTQVITKGALPQEVTHLSSTERLIFGIIFCLLFLFSCIGNVAAVFVTTRRKHRFIQKLSIISLALGDLIMTLAYSINNIETFSHPMVNWTLGKFTCSLIPMAQVFGLIINVASLVVVAIDRYRNIARILARQWNPSRSICIFGFGLIWLLSLFVSFPIFPMFNIKVLRVYYDPPKKFYKLYEFCVSPVKSQLEKYYISAAILVFGALWALFIYLNFKVAKVIWSLRKPPQLTPSTPTHHDSLSTDTSTTACTSTSVAEKAIRNDRLINRTGAVQTVNRKLQIQRKIRTFKIIVTLMCIFTVCRLPFWIFNIVKVSEVLNDHWHWLFMYGVNALALFNCAINPLLYSFLQPSLACIWRLWKFVKNFLKKVCCWYFSASEFEDFEKNNPFPARFEMPTTAPTPRLQQIKSISESIVRKKLYVLQY